MTYPHLSSSQGDKTKCLTFIIVPSLQTCCCRFLCATRCSRGLPTHIRESGHCRHPGCAVLLSQRSQGSGEKGRGEAEAGSSCDLCLFSEIRLLSSCSLTCCLLLIIILFLYLSLQNAHLLLLHGNHLLVSLSCSAASVIHNIPPPHRPSQQHWDGCSSQNVQSASSFATIPLFTLHPGSFGFDIIYPPKM